MFFKTSFIRNFAIFAGTNLCWSLNKVAGLTADLSKRDFNTRVFCEYCKTFTKSFSYRAPSVAAFFCLIK